MTAVRSPVRRGFSLTELLVVIGILVVLIGILLPALGRAREMARQVKCASNMRQLVQAVLTYAGDNNGYLPQPNDHDFEAPLNPALITNVGWLYAPPTPSYTNGVPTTQEADSVDQTGTLWPYLKAFDVYHCPDDNAEQPYPVIQASGGPSSQPAHYLTSYMMTDLVNGFSGHPTATGYPHTYAFPLRKMPTFGVLFWECGEDDPTVNAKADYPWNDGASFPDQGLSNWHLGGSQVACFNGTVTWLSQAQIQQELQETPGPFWCNPVTANGQ